MVETLRADAVFEGGGVKGIGLVGALAVIEQAGYELVNVAGTSAGAIVASLVAAGYSAAELKSILMGLDFTQFMDAPVVEHVPAVGKAWDAIEIITQLGMYDGDFFLSLMQDLLEKKGIRTFGDLILPEYSDPRYRFKLRVIVSDISRGCMVALPQDIADYGMEPEELGVAEAVRMSMSIPYFFKPVKLKSQMPGGRESYIVDGGLLSNFPIWLFDSNDADGPPAWPTFGFRLVHTEGALPVVKHPIAGPITELAAMFFTAMEAHDAYYIKTDNFARTIAIDTLGVGSTDFGLDQAKKDALYASGEKAATDFLQQWNFEGYVSRYRSGKPIPSRHEMVLHGTLDGPGLGPNMRG